MDNCGHGGRKYLSYSGRAQTVPLYLPLWMAPNVFQLSSEEQKRKVVSSKEEHFNEWTLELEQLKHNVDPTADAQYDISLSTVFFSVLTLLVG